MTTQSSQTSQSEDMGIDLGQFHEIFFEEAGEHLAIMESLLLAIGEEAPSDDDLNAIFRAAHSIKGGAAMFGFSDVAGLTHDMESVLDLVRKHQLGLTSDMIEAFLQAGDLTTQMLGRHRAGEATGGANEEVEALRARLQALKNGAPSPATPSIPAAMAMPPAQVIVQSAVQHPTAPVTGTSADASFARIVDHVSGRATGPAATDADVRSLATYVGGTPGPVVSGQSGTPLEGEGFGFFVDPTKAKNGGPVVDAAAVSADIAIPKNTAAQTEPGKPRPTPAAAATTKPASAGESNSIRVAIERVDQLINMVGELVITQSMLTERASKLDPATHRGFVGTLGDLERNTRALQETVMSIRMLPMSMVFNRFPRMVRDTAAKLGKKIELKLVGEATELDKGMIEKIIDPLTHLVRNSVDHGIEQPAKRMTAGKSPHGTVTLSAAHEGGSIVIVVADDGAGLPRDKILAKAKERGMPVTDAMTDQEVWSLIFEPGFSTATEVTDISGRGVGMDVVKRNISALSGTVEITSELGKGTRMTVRLPLTLAIMDGMSVAVGGETYILPLGSIVESLQIDAALVKTVNVSGRVVKVRSEYLPVVALRDVFGCSELATEPAALMLVIVMFEGGKTALLVDDLVGQHQIVVKNLESNYRKVPGISGATIMGDGRVGLILDVASLVRRARH
ncbi:MAG: chemotaxis protein CheA [Burkholderiales bacterium]